MEIWELAAREQIRDLVARYNASGDAGRFAEMVKVFSPDAVMELVAADGSVRRFEGIEAISSIFTGTKSDWDATTKQRPRRHHVRHFVATHQIDLDDPEHARGRSYYLVLMAHGLDHWGRYVDRYETRAGRWLIVERRCLSDGRAAPGSDPL